MNIQISLGRNESAYKQIYKITYLRKKKLARVYRKISVGWNFKFIDLPMTGNNKSSL